jgi:hypothetical protein
MGVKIRQNKETGRGRGKHEDGASTRTGQARGRGKHEDGASTRTGQAPSLQYTELYPSMGNIRGRSCPGYFLAKGGAYGGDDFFCEEMGLGFFVAYRPEDEGVHAQVVVVVGELVDPLAYGACDDAFSAWRHCRRTRLKNGASDVVSTPDCGSRSSCILCGILNGGL